MRWLAIACLAACGFERNDTPPQPRLISPLSTSFVATPNPTLRFALPATLSNPIVELCRDRACSGALLHGTLDASQGSATAPPLTVGLWYWRVRASSPMGSAISAVWQFRVTAGTSGVVWGGALDLDGDGFDELAVGTPEATVSASGLSDGRVYLYAGGPSGPDATRVTVLDSPAGGGFGSALATVDFNGDGFADLAVGAPQAKPGDGSDGAVFVYYGGPNGIAAQPDLMLTVPEGSNVGWAIDSARDFNGDGYGDLVVGAPTTVVQEQISGVVYVFSGAAHGSGMYNALQPEVGPLLQLGASVAGGGDLDGDGLDDIVVGAPGASPGGHAWMIPGGSNSADVHLLDDAGAPANALFGYSLLFRGDSDGDGLCDLAIGEPQAGPGHVFLYQGVRGQPPAMVGQLDGPDGDRTRFGVRMVAGDIAADGVLQLAVGATCAPIAGDCDGRVYLNPGPNATIYSGPPQSSYGIGLSMLDADGDGKADLAIGTDVYTNDLGRADWYEDATGAPRIFNGSDAGGRFGYVIR